MVNYDCSSCLLCILNVQCDIENPQVDVSKLEDFCSKHGIRGWYVLPMIMETFSLVVKICDL